MTRLRARLSDVFSLLVVLIYLFVGVEMILHRNSIALRALALMTFMITHMPALPMRW